MPCPSLIRNNISHAEPGSNPFLFHAPNSSSKSHKIWYSLWHDFDVWLNAADGIARFENIYIGVVFLQRFAQHLIETFGWLAEEIEEPAKSAWGNFLYELPLDGLCDEAAEIFATRRINTWKMHPDIIRIVLPYIFVWHADFVWAPCLAYISNNVEHFYLIYFFPTYWLYGLFRGESHNKKLRGFWMFESENVCKSCELLNFRKKEMEKIQFILRFESHPNFTYLIRTFTSIHKHSRTFTNIHKHLNLKKKWKSPSVV